MKEISRVENIEEFPYKTNCTVCGNEVTLWYNGGELDYDECCGQVYELEIRQIDFVVSKTEDDR